MTMTFDCAHASDERLTLYFYGELPADERRRVHQHLAGCEICRAALAELEQLRSALSLRGDVTRRPNEWDAFMERLLPKLDAYHRDSASEQVEAHRGYPSRALAIAAALVLAVASGLLWQRGALDPPRAPITDPADTDAALAAAAERHFERAKLVVLGIAMKDPAQTSGADWEYERQLAASLLPETRLFRLSAADHGDARLASLLGDLETVLLQASMTTDGDAGDLQRLQRVIRRRDLLVRMDLREL